MRKLLPVLFVSLVLCAKGQQQNSNPCLTDQLNDKMLHEHPELVNRQQKFYEQVDQYRASSVKKLNKAGVVRIIPVVFHVIHANGPENISKQKIEDQIRRLNEDFRRQNADTFKTRPAFKASAVDCEVEFRLANIDPNGRCTDGVVRVNSQLTFGGNDAVKNLSRWDNTKYLNIWVVADITDTDSDPGTTTLGYAYLPWSTNSNIDGIVVRADRVSYQHRTLTHEVGHYLGLQHTFQSGCVTANCSNSGDRCCDTPPVAGPSFGCNLSLLNCQNNPVQIENYMDYADDGCMNMFSANQKSIIDAVFDNIDIRTQLIDNANLIATGTDDEIYNLCGPKADFYTLANTTCQAMSISFFDATWRSESYTLAWEFQGGNPSISSATNPTITYNTPGTYQVKLKATNAFGSDSVIRTSYITVKPGIGDKKAPISQDFEGSNFSTGGWSIDQTTPKWQMITSVGYSGTASIRAPINSTTAAGATMSFYSPSIDLSNYKSTDPAPSVYFRYAYKQRVTGTDATNDALKMYISQDCGASWVQRINKVGPGLSTSAGAGANFVPASKAEWKTIKYDLSAYMSSTGGNKNIILRFEAVSDQGGPIYVDDINIAYGALGVNELPKNVVNLSLYPNPAENSSTLVYDLVAASDVSISVTDITGREVYSSNLGKLAQGPQQFEINSSLFSGRSTNGVYFVKLSANGNTFVQKLVLLGTTSY